MRSRSRRPSSRCCPLRSACKKGKRCTTQRGTHSCTSHSLPRVALLPRRVSVQFTCGTRSRGRCAATTCTVLLLSLTTAACGLLAPVACDIPSVQSPGRNCCLTMRGVQSARNSPVCRLQSGASGDSNASTGRANVHDVPCCLVCCSCRWFGCSTSHAQGETLSHAPQAKPASRSTASGACALVVQSLVCRR